MTDSLPQFGFAPRLYSVFWKLALVILLVVSTGFFLSGRETFDTTREAAALHLKSLEASRLFREATSPEQARSAALSGMEVVEKESRELLDAIDARGREPGPVADARYLSALRKAQFAVERRMTDAIHRQTSVSRFWVWRFWITWLAGAALIWAASSLLVFWTVRPVLHLSRSVDELDPSRIEEDFRQRLEAAHYRYFMVPREVLELWWKISRTIGSVTRVREADFIALERQKAMAEATALELRESEESKRHFLGLLSHEIRTPVTSLVLATRLLERQAPELADPRQRRLIETCAKDVERLRGLLEDLLSISRFDAMTLKLSLREADVRKLFRSSLDSFSAEVRSRELEVDTEVSTDVDTDWQAEVDAPKLAWAFSNVLLHSIRHAAKGGRIRTHLRCSPDRGGFEFVVIDPSRVAGAHELQRITGVHGSGYDLRVARTEATGSSIAIARQIVESHGGSLVARASESEGTVFLITIPSGRSEHGQVASGG